MKNRPLVTEDRTNVRDQFAEESPIMIKMPYFSHKISTKTVTKL